MIDRTRRGIIRVEESEWIESDDLRDRVAGHMVPIRIVRDDMTDFLEIYGYSDHFESIPLNTMPPYYILPPEPWEI